MDCYTENIGKENYEIEARDWGNWKTNGVKVTNYIKNIPFDYNLLLYHSLEASSEKVLSFFAWNMNF